MADYPISDVSRRAQYSGSAGVGPYSFSFEILAQGDVAIYKNSTLLALTTDYTVTINMDGTGSVTLVVAATGSDVITIIGARNIERVTDFVTGGDLLAASLNEELDSQTIFTQQLYELAQRTLRFEPYAEIGGVDVALPSPVAGRGIKWNDTATGFELTDADPDTIAAAAAASASAASASATLSQGYATNSLGYANQSAASATTSSGYATSAAAQAALSAASAASASSFTAQNLTAIDQAIFASTTFVTGIIYDTSKDSDGGAWRDRCSHTSWENETLSGNWLGSAANETAARAISGATTGSYYYDTTAALFKSLNAGSGTTTVYRGNVRKFPARVAVTVETARVILWDLTQAGVPMWMVFAGVSNNLWANNNGKAVAMRDGLLCIADGTYDLCLANFVSDSALRYSTAGISGRYKAAIASRNSGSGHDASISAAIVNRACNSVAITALPNAPIDVATGLPVPTMAVATVGGISVLKDDGTVVNSSATSTNIIAISGTTLWCGYSSNGAYLQRVDLVGIGASFTLTSISLPWTPWPNGGTSNAGITAEPQRNNQIWRGASTGLVALRHNAGTATSGMVNYINKDYNSGWQPGDIRLAALSDTTAETLTASGELVTNGTFNTDITGWAKLDSYGGGNGTIAWNAVGALDVTNDGSGSNHCVAYQAITCVVGKSYVVVFDQLVANGYVCVCTGIFSGSIASMSIGAGNGYALQFTATATTLYICFSKGSATAGANTRWDNISVRSADPDRCVKANGLTVTGSITKAAVAASANLVGYSGWSAANYLARAYDADFDFGTGTFWIGGWLKEAANSAIETLLERDSASTAQRFTVSVTAAGYLEFTCDDNTTTRTATGTVAVDDSVWRFVSFSYSAGTLTIKVNGASYASATGAALLTLNNASAVLDVGKDVAGSYPATNATMALWRTSATIPSAEQIAFIYETEKALFEANTQCTLAGTSNSIIALGYDEDSDLLHAMTSYGRSTFKRLVRVASEATAVGTPKAVAASGGAILQLGSTSSDIYIPAYSLREEMTRLDEQTAAFGAPTQFFDFDATASQTTFTLGVGWEIVAVYAASGAGSATLQREGSGKQWTRSFDGFKWSAVFASGRSASDWVSIEARRIVK
jgi:hypothetical protein